jgi:hypothetical protein
MWEKISQITNLCFPLEFTKVLVGGGFTIIGQYTVRLNSSEVIDLKSPNTVCKNLPNLPTTLVCSIGGLGFQNKPLICAGQNETVYTKSCNTLEGNLWTPSASMINARILSGVSAFPYQNKSRKLIATGGYGLLAMGYGLFEECRSVN